jgi:hypothetical protein
LHASDHNRNVEAAHQLKSDKINSLTDPDEQIINRIAVNNDTSYYDDYYHGSLSTCILGTAQIYLDWWVNEDGSLPEKLAEYNACKFSN